ncbi:MAG TPA: UDP-N-acetylglucosamine 1-carboxyvinyltransferase, partial [Acidobacteriota bacterium]|nr:UDP-N-acetylglucosamine 1-carboxyvinyltransferase [Acidobacteriota bacterium]
MNRKFVIAGRQVLRGDYPVQGNKNAALPLISAALLADTEVVLRNVPRISDVENLVRIIEHIGVQAEWDKTSLRLNPRSLSSADLPDHLVESLRGAVLLFGVLAPRFGQLDCAVPGGCPIGRRSFNMHWEVFQAAGFSVVEEGGRISLKWIDQPTPEVFLEESSVTATENALILFASLGKGVIGNPAREPHVVALIDFLRLLGCEIETHPLFYRVTRGVQPQKSVIDFEVPPDFIDAGTIATATAVTGGSVRLHGIRKLDLIGFQRTLSRFGIQFRRETEEILEVSSGMIGNPPVITAGPWPSFPTDLVSIVIVLATQGTGTCLIHDWMYEARMFFVDKLSRMGARITICDPHRVLVEGPHRLRGIRLESPDIRAGMALVVAGLCAEGNTTIEHAEVILRGYERVAHRLAAIGA